jgi:two-component sensor histidine kinase
MQAEAQKNLLIEELNHRVKNTLAIVQSLAAMTIKHSQAPNLFYQAFFARLRALSVTHDLLTQGAWERAPLDALLAVELKPYAGQGDSRVTKSGPAVDLPPRQTIGLGMVFHELATNAAKYGALSTPTGRISISWKVAADAGTTWLRLEWDEAAGPLVKRPIRRGFGSRLIEQSINHELGGRFEPTFAAEGFRCSIAVPI